MPTQERLQKVLAHAGVASRRASEQLIRQGRVTVNGQVVVGLGTRVDPAQDQIAVDGKPIRIEPKVYVLLHKPPGYLSTVDDPHGRPTVLNLVSLEARVYPVGRLDLDSEGLLLLTNDGELADRLTHPRYQHEKEYHVLVNGWPSAEALERLRQGVELEDGRTAPARVEILRREAAPERTWLRVILREGRKRQIRRMCQAVGHPVERLIRVRMGPINLGDLPPGHWRHLSHAELTELRRELGL